MVFLASYLAERGFNPSRCTVFLGGRSTDDLLCREDFLRIGMKLYITTDDGSAGDQCFVTHPLETESEKLRPDIVYACGPMDMLKCVVGIAEKHGVPCQISIETMMACGIGACLGCAVERKEASGNFEQVMEIIRMRPEGFLVVSGDDAITLPMIAAGGDGAISVIANAYPAITSLMVAAALDASYIKARELHYRLFPMMRAIFKEGNPAGVKAAMEIQGWIDNVLRLPLIPVSSVLYQEIVHLDALLQGG